MSKHLPLFLVCLTILLSVLYLSKTKFVIRNDSSLNSDTISVTGDGKVFAKPDMATIAISFEETAPTSKEALNQVNQKISQARQVLKDNNIADVDISTSSLNIYTDYDYSNSTRKILGQRASQSLEIKIKKIDDKATRAATIVDALSAIDKLQIQGITFDIEDRTKFYSEARKLAFNKAKQKAEELASLGGLRLTKPVSITDTGYDYTPRVANYALSKVGMGGGADSATDISPGQLEVSTNLTILWGVK